jgi:AbrB family looped-hinge helix DNA binding protein
LSYLTLVAVMPITHLSSRGQIVIPKSIREAHNWTAGQEFEIVESGNALVLRPKKPFPETTLDEVAGCLEYDGPPIPVEQLSGTYALQKKLKQEKGESQ